MAPHFFKEKPLGFQEEEAEEERLAGWMDSPARVECDGSMVTIQVIQKAGNLRPSLNLRENFLH